jgi:hypothetical protein
MLSTEPTRKALLQTQGVFNQLVKGREALCAETATLRLCPSGAV